ncbi:hypothetical protein FRB96_002878 [Tulasnella sp. 330]|nr:hypothetical protein FRB96_002878 [Tulasnella sp. 330]
MASRVTGSNSQACPRPGALSLAANQRNFPPHASSQATAMPAGAGPPRVGGPRRSSVSSQQTRELAIVPVHWPDASGSGRDHKAHRNRQGRAAALLAVSQSTDDDLIDNEDLTAAGQNNGDPDFVMHDVGSPQLAPISNITSPDSQKQESKNTFPYQLLRLVEDGSKPSIEYSADGNGIRIPDIEAFTKEIIEPKVMWKMKEFGHFVKQLNLYGFQKVKEPKGSRGCVYRHREGMFHRDQPDDIKYVVHIKHEKTHNWEAKMEDMQRQMDAMQHRMDAMEHRLNNKQATIDRLEQELNEHRQTKAKSEENILETLKWQCRWHQEWIRSQGVPSGSDTMTTGEYPGTSSMGPQYTTDQGVHASSSSQPPSHGYQSTPVGHWSSPMANVDDAQSSSPYMMTSMTGVSTSSFAPAHDIYTTWSTIPTEPHGYGDPEGSGPIPQSVTSPDGACVDPRVLHNSKQQPTPRPIARPENYAEQGRSRPSTEEDLAYSGVDKRVFNETRSLPDRPRRKAFRHPGMASQPSPLCILPPAVAIQDNDVHLMPFNIGFTGIAPLSTFWMIRDAPKPAKTDNSDTTELDVKPEDGDARPSGDMQSEIPATGADDQKMDEGLDTTSGQCLPDVHRMNLPTALEEEQEKRFVSAFRGRALHGLMVPLPEGYGGIVLSVLGETSFQKKNEKEAVAESAKRKRNGRGGDRSASKARKIEAGDGATKSRGRMTRSKSHTVIAQTKDEEDDEDMASKEDEPEPEAALDVMNDDSDKPARQLRPTSTFSSLTVWAADNPVDTGRDDYIKSLDEWIRLSSLVHEI